MRIAKATLTRDWARCSGLALAVFVVLAWLDYRLKSLTGVGTAELSGFSDPAQFHLAFQAWGPEPYAARAGFNLGLDYLLMPLYAASFFYSGIIAAEGFAPRPSGLRRAILAAIWVPVIGAFADAIENAMHLTMLLHGADAGLAAMAAGASRVKNVALLIGLVLFLGAAMAKLNERRRRG